jgi:hypothetical protein
MLHGAVCGVVMNEVAGLIFLRWKGRALHHWRQMLMRFAALNVSSSNAVDIFDAISGKWSNATLSEARVYLAAASLPNQGLAIFAGGAGMFFVVTNEIASCCMSWVVKMPWLVICFLGVRSAADSVCDVQVQNSVVQ